MVYRLILAYRGTRYAGWQRQDNALSVQQVVEEALAGLLRAPATLVGASRTDAGVHARGQAAHLLLAEPFPPRGLVHGTNHRLPEDVRVMAAARMAAGFHARRAASGKEYRYRLVRGEVLSPLEEPMAVLLPRAPDLALLREAAGLLVGEHDFAAFARTGGSHTHTRRRIARAEWLEDGPALVFRVVGDGFLRGMVRALVGTLLEIGLGRRPLDSLPHLLEGRPRGEAGPNAPAKGLILERVLYPPRWQPLAAEETEETEEGV